jgi:hypothetical protein
MQHLYKKTKKPKNQRTKKGTRYKGQGTRKNQAPKNQIKSQISNIKQISKVNLKAKKSAA